MLLDDIETVRTAAEAEAKLYAGEHVKALILKGREGWHTFTEPHLVQLTGACFTLVRENGVDSYFHVVPRGDLQQDPNFQDVDVLMPGLQYTLDAKTLEGQPYPERSWTLLDGRQRLQDPVPGV